VGDGHVQAEQAAALGGGERDPVAAVLVSDESWRGVGQFKAALLVRAQLSRCQPWSGTSAESSSARFFPAAVGITASQATAVPSAEYPPPSPPNGGHEV